MTTCERESRGMRVSLALLVTLAVSLSACPAPSQAAGAAGGLAAGPTLQQLSLASGAEGTLHIDLKNMSTDAPLPVQVVLTDINPSGDLRPVGSTPQSLTGVLSLPAGPVLLSPGEMRAVTLLAHGDGRTHFGAVLAVAGPAGAPFARIVLRIVLAPSSVDPDPRFRLTVTAGGVITLSIANSDQTICAGQGALFLMRPDGAFLGRLDVPEFELLPRGTASLVMRWPEALPPGTTARAALSVNGRDAPYIASASVPTP